MSNGMLKWIKGYNSNQKIIFFAVISLICYLLMGTNIFGIQSDFDTSYMLDLKFYYSGDTFFNTLTNISEIQANYYQITHYIDYIFILTFYPMLALIISKNVYKRNQYYILAPILAMGFDTLENLIIDIQLSHGVSIFFANVCGIFTALKFIYIGISIVLIITNFIQQRRKLKHVDI